MKISVYDTYVKNNNNNNNNNNIVMHFDILVEESKTLEDALGFWKGISGIKKTI